ncbi:MAG: outer membrane lipoprotein-sorting protein [Leptospirales bacterium]
MTRKIKIITVIGAATIACMSLFAGGPSGLSIMQKNDALREPETTVSESVMVILKGKSQEKKEFRMVMKKYGDKTRSRSTFTSPTRIEFLNWSQPGKDALQWIKLSGGTVRKIASSEKGGAFVGSHFYYEDIGVRDISDYNYKYLGEKEEAGENCYLVEGVKKTGTKVYEKSIIYVRKSDYYIIRIDLYEKKGHTKIFWAQKIEKISGIITARKVVMERTDGKGKSLIYLKKIQYNTNVSNSLLTREGLD